MKEKIVELPLTDVVIRTLHAGDRVLLRGVLYTGRDDAHMHLVELLRRGEPLPVDLRGQCIYYVGPCPAKPGQVIGSAGPEHGLKGMIGKGQRSAEVVETMRRCCCVYFAAIGGAGALLARQIREAEVVAFPELGPEAIYRLRVEDFPVTVVVDCAGNDLYRTGRAEYARNGG